MRLILAKLCLSEQFLRTFGLISTNKKQIYYLVKVYGLLLFDNDLIFKVTMDLNMPIFQ